VRRPFLRFRTFNHVDDYSRECPTIEVDTSLSGARVVRELQRVAPKRDLLDTIVMDNGPELTSRALLAWRQQSEPNLHYVQPGKPTKNAIVESFNGKMRDECLNQHYFVDLRHARKLIEDWKVSYNAQRPHTSLRSQTPEEYRKSFERKNLETTMHRSITRSLCLT
jgi:putative transposase